VTNTRIKFVVVLKDIVGDTHVRSVRFARSHAVGGPRSNSFTGWVQWFRELHTLFVATMSNPFSSLNTKLESPRFDQHVTRLALSYEKKTVGAGAGSAGGAGVTS
jgi:hypothetical protein